MQPLKPMAPPGAKGRAFDYLFGWNLNYIPRATEAIDFPTLKRVAETCDIARLLIETRKDRMAVIDWEIRPKEVEKSGGKRPGASKFKSQIDEVTALIKSPDRRLAWGQWVREVLEQNLVIDALSVYRRKNRSGKIYSWELIDGATIKTLFDADGRTPLPPSPAYQQIIKGIPAANYATWTTGDMLYFPENPRVDRGYGYSRIEQSIRYINLQLARVRSQLGWYEEGNVPEGFIEAPAEMSLEQVKTMQDWWDSLAAGAEAIEMRRRVWWLPQGSKYQPMKEAVLKSEFDEWIARVLCFAFSEDPTPFVKQSTRATAETAQQKAEAEGLLPSMLYVQRLMNTLIELDFGYTDIEFAWSLDTEFDPQKKAVLDNLYARAGIRSIDEIRESLGDEPLGGAFATPMIATATGYVPVDPAHAAEIAATRTPTPPAANGQQNGQQNSQGKDGEPKQPGGKGGKGGKAQDGDRSSPKTRAAGGESAAVGSGSGGERTAKNVEIVRHVLNAHEIVEWARKAIAPASAVLTADALKVTSGTWPDPSSADDQPSVIYTEGGTRSIESLADGRLALFFNAPELDARMAELAGGETIENWTAWRAHIPLTLGPAAIVLEKGFEDVERDERGRFSGSSSSREPSKEIKSHPNYDASDYKHLSEKGYSDREIKALWDRDHSAGRGPQPHREIPNVTGSMAAFLENKTKKVDDKGGGESIDPLNKTATLTPAAPYAGPILIGPEQHTAPVEDLGAEALRADGHLRLEDLRARNQAAVQPGPDLNVRQEAALKPSWKLAKATRTEVDAAAAQADASPSRPQIEAGNYRHGHVKIHGLDVSIENAAGTKRSGIGKDGETWSVTMPVHYGYIKRSTGADGEHVDVYLGPDPEATTVWIIDQVDAETGKFDEHKCMLGFESWAQAQSAYIAAFSDGRGHERLGHVSSMSVEAFRAWLGEPQTEPRSMVQKRDAALKLHRLHERRGEPCEEDCQHCKAVTVATGLTHHDQLGQEVGESRRRFFTKAGWEGVTRDPKGRWSGGGSGAKPSGGRQTPSTFAHPQTGRALSRTETGDTFEALALAKANENIAQFLGVRECCDRLSGPGNRTAPYDAQAGKWAIEIKTLSSGAQSQKTAIKAEELERKNDFAKENKLKPALVVQVVDQKSRSVSVYGLKHLGSIAVTKMERITTYSYSAKDLARAGLKKYSEDEREGEPQPGDLVIEVHAGEPHVYLVPGELAKRDYERDEHGRFASTGGLPKSLYERIGQPDGGFTYQPSTHSEPKGGYAVSPYPDRSSSFDAKAMKLADVARYMKQNADAFKDPKNYVGAWHDPASGKIYLDVSRVADSHDEARQLCQQHDQIAYFDLSAGKSIEVNRAATSGGQAHKVSHGGRETGTRDDAARRADGGAHRHVQAADGARAHGAGDRGGQGRARQGLAKRARRIPPPPFATAENRRGEAAIRSALVTAFQKLRAHVAAQVRTELARLKKQQFAESIAKDVPRDDRGRWTVSSPVAGTYVAHDRQGREVGRANLAESGEYATTVHVEPEHRRQGVATALYAHIERETGRKLKPSPTYRTPDGQAFWESRTGKIAKAAGDEDDPEWILAGKVAEQLDVDGLTFVIDETEGALTAAAQSAGEAMLGGMGIDETELVDQLDQRAADWAVGRSAELVGMRYDENGDIEQSANAEMRIDESTRQMVREVIYQGLVEGKRSTEIADDLERGTADADYPFSEERAALIANTEIRRAHAQGSLEGMRTAQDAGVVVKKEWITSGHATVCDDCQENADAGAIDVEDDFPSGDDSPPAHPDCNCDVVAAVDDEEPKDTEDDSEKVAGAIATAASRAMILAKILDRSATVANDAKIAKARADQLQRELSVEREAHAEDVAKAEAARKNAEQASAVAVADARLFAQDDHVAQREALIGVLGDLVKSNALVLGEQRQAMDTTISNAVEALQKAVADMTGTEKKRLAIEQAGQKIEMMIERLEGGRFRVVRTEKPAAP